MLWIYGGISSFNGTPVDTIINRLILPGDRSAFLDFPWTILTYMFTQISPLHLLGNILWLYWFGMLFCHLISKRGVITTYLIGGITGGLLYIATAPAYYSTLPPLAGASAAVLAIITAVAGCRPTTRLNLFIFGDVKLIWIAVIALALTFLGGAGGMESALWAHFGGAGAGILISIYFRLNETGWNRSSVEKFRKNLHRLRLKRKSGRIKKVFIDASPTDRSIESSRGRAYNKERLDQLLDKIRISGYESLSAAEREELELLSRNI